MIQLVSVLKQNQMPSIKRKLKTFLTKRMGPKPTERREIDFSFVPSAHEEFRSQTTKMQMSLNRREMRIDDDISKIKRDLLKMRAENGALMTRCTRLDSDIDQEQIGKISVSSQTDPRERDFEDFSDLSICSDDDDDDGDDYCNLAPFSGPISCRPRLETVASHTEGTSAKSSLDIENKSEDSPSNSPLTDTSECSFDQSPVKDSSLDETPTRTLNRQFYRAPKRIPNSTNHISAGGKSFSENDCPPVLNRYSMLLPERPHSSFMDYFHSSQRHIMYNKMNAPQLLHTNSESILEQSMTKPKSFATDVFDEVRKSIGDLSIHKTSTNC